MRGPTEQSRAAERLVRKKLAFLAAGPRRTRQARHQKAKTQNLDIPSILHSGGQNDLSRPREERPYVSNTSVFEKTYDAPLRQAKAQLRSQHELMLARELRSFQSEVEARFSNSLPNRTYHFPRTGDVPASDTAEPSGRDMVSRDRESDSSPVMASIYEQITCRKEETKIGGTTRGPGEGRHRRGISEHFYRQVRGLLARRLPPNPNPKLYSTQCLVFGSDNGVTAKKYESSPERTLQLQQQEPSRTQNAFNLRKAQPQREKLPELISGEGTRDPNRKSHSHVRTKTQSGDSFNNSTKPSGNTAMALKKIVYLIKRQQPTGKSRTGAKKTMATDYFRGLVQHFPSSKSTVRGARAQMVNALSLSAINTTRRTTALVKGAMMIAEGTRLKL